MIGRAAPAFWRGRDLVQHRVAAYRNGVAAGEGSGANVLGVIRIALTWIANEPSSRSATSFGRRRRHHRHMPDACRCRARRRSPNGFWGVRDD
jgi:hypothetical protein